MKIAISLSPQVRLLEIESGDYPVKSVTITAPVDEASPGRVVTIELQHDRSVHRQHVETAVGKEHRPPELFDIETFEDLLRFLEGVEGQDVDVRPEGEMDSDHDDSSVGEAEAATSATPTVEGAAAVGGSEAVGDSDSLSPAAEDPGLLRAFTAKGQGARSLLLLVPADREPMRLDDTYSAVPHIRSGLLRLGGWSVTQSVVFTDSIREVRP